jgi:hypothetical protein
VSAEQRNGRCGHPLWSIDRSPAGLCCAPCVGDRCELHGGPPASSEGDVLELLFTRGPGPDSEFVEAEVNGRGVNCGEWTQRDGYWRLRITRASLDAALRAEVRW